MRIESTINYVKNKHNIHVLEILVLVLKQDSSRPWSALTNSQTLHCSIRSHYSIASSTIRRDCSNIYGPNWNYFVEFRRSGCVFRKRLVVDDLECSSSSDSRVLRNLRESWQISTRQPFLWPPPRPTITTLADSRDILSAFLLLFEHAFVSIFCSFIFRRTLPTIIWLEIWKYNNMNRYVYCLFN